MSAKESVREIELETKNFPLAMGMVEHLIHFFGDYKAKME